MVHLKKIDICLAVMRLITARSHSFIKSSLELNKTSFAFEVYSPAVWVIELHHTLSEKDRHQTSDIGMRTELQCCGDFEHPEETSALECRRR